MIKFLTRETDVPMWALMALGVLFFIMMVATAGRYVPPKSKSEVIKARIHEIDRGFGYPRKVYEVVIDGRAYLFMAGGEYLIPKEKKE